MTYFLRGQHLIVDNKIDLHNYIHPYIKFILVKFTHRSKIGKFILVKFTHRSKIGNDLDDGL